MSKSQQLVSIKNPYLKKNLSNNQITSPPFITPVACKSSTDAKSVSTNVPKKLPCAHQELRNNLREKNVSVAVTGISPTPKKQGREQVAKVKKHEKCSSLKSNRTKLRREIEALKELKRQKLLSLKANNIREDSTSRLDLEPAAVDAAAVADSYDQSSVNAVAEQPNCITPTNTRYPQKCILQQTINRLNTSEENPVVASTCEKTADSEQNKNCAVKALEELGQQDISSEPSISTKRPLERSPEQDAAEQNPQREFRFIINQVTIPSNSNPTNNGPEMTLLSPKQQSSLAMRQHQMIHNYYNYNPYVPPYTNSIWFQNSINAPVCAYPYYYYHHQQPSNFTYHPIGVPYEQLRQQQLCAPSLVETKDTSPPFFASESESLSSNKQMPSLQQPYYFSLNNSYNGHMNSSCYPTYPFPTRNTSYDFPPCYPNHANFSPHLHYSGWAKTNLNLRTRLSKKPTSKVLFLSAKPIDSPSPWSKTHAIIPNLITVSKSKNCSYGFEVKFMTKYNYEVKCCAATGTSTPEASSLRSLEEASDLSTIKTDSIPIKTLEEKPLEQMQTKTSRKRRTYGAIIVTNPGRQSHTLQEGDIILSIEGVPVGLEAKTELFSQALTLLKNGNDGFEEVCCTLEIARRVSVGLTQKLDRKEIVPTDTTTTDEKKQQLETVVDLNPFIIDDNTQKVISGEFSEEEMKILVFKIQQHLGEALERDSTLLWERIALSLPRRDALSVHKKWLHAIHEYETEMKMKAARYWKKKWILEEEKASSSTGYPAKGGETEGKYRFLSDAARAQLRAYPRPALGCRCGSINHQRVDDDSCILYRNNRLLLPMSSEIPSSDHAISKELKVNEKKKKTTKSAVFAAGLDRIRRLKSELAADRKEAEFINEMELRQVQNGSAIFAPSLSMMVISAVAVISSLKLSKRCDEVDEDDLPLTAVATRLMDPTATLVEIAAYISRTWGAVSVEPSYVQMAWRCKVHELITGKAFPRDGFVAASFAMPQNVRLQGRHSFENLRFLLDNEEVIQRLQRFQWAETPRTHQDEFLAEQQSKLAAETLMFTYLLSSWKTGLLDEVYSLQESGVLERLGAGIVLKKNWAASVDPMLLEEMHESWGNDERNRHCIQESVRQQLLSSWQRTDDGWIFDSQLHYSHKEFELKHYDFVNEFEEWQDEVQGVGKFGL